MAFETYPLPGAGAKIDEVMSRVADQHAMLLPVVSNLLAGLDGAVNGQGSALTKIGNKLVRSVNGRIKNQGGATSAVVAPLYAAIQNGIATQGSNLSLQSALLPRLSAPQAPVTRTPVMPGAPSTFVPSNVGGAGQTPTVLTVPSLPAGVTAPLFSLVPSEVTPPTYQPPTQPSGAAGWGVVVDCDKGTMDVYDLSSETNPWVRGEGSFVPIRYDIGREDLYANWLGRGEGNPYTANIQYQPQWIAIACHARANGGEGWPFMGDFPHDGNTNLANGFPVGNWPFDRAGNYIGM